MRFITPENTNKRDFHQFMLGAIVPRPIAMVSSRGKNGVNNIAPFSYFNAVSSIPPIFMLSIGRKADGSKKDTLINIEETGEFVINMVSHKILGQMALSSVAFIPEKDEFEMTGLNQLDSKFLIAKRIKESPIQMECKVRKILEFGSGPGESTVVFGDMLCMYLDERVIDDNNRIDPNKLDIMGRLGRSYYTRIEKGSIETLVQAQSKIPIGFVALPANILNSKILSGNDLSILASALNLPSKEEIDKLKALYVVIDNETLHKEIKNALLMGEMNLALRLVFLSEPSNY